MDAQSGKSRFAQNLFGKIFEQMAVLDVLGPKKPKKFGPGKIHRAGTVFTLAPGLRVLEANGWYHRNRLAEYYNFHIDHFSQT